MKEQIKKLLNTKGTKELVDLNPYLKAATGNILTRERTQDLKKALNELVESGQILIVNDAHKHLDSVNSNYDNTGNDGLALPTKYHNLDTVSLLAYGTNTEAVSAPAAAPKPVQLMTPEHLEEVKKRLSGGVYAPKPEEPAKIELPEPVEEIPAEKPAELPIQEPAEETVIEEKPEEPAGEESKDVE